MARVINMLLIKAEARKQISAAYIIIAKGMVLIHSQNLNNELILINPK